MKVSRYGLALCVASGGTLMSAILVVELYREWPCAGS
jgi:hypothetical protein